MWIRTGSTEFTADMLWEHQKGNSGNSYSGQKQRREQKRNRRNRADKGEREMKITKEKIIQLTAGWIPGILTVFFFHKNAEHP